MDPSPSVSSLSNSGGKDISRKAIQEQTLISNLKLKLQLLQQLNRPKEEIDECANNLLAVINSFTDSAVQEIIGDTKDRSDSMEEVEDVDDLSTYV